MSEGHLDDIEGDGEADHLLLDEADSLFVGSVFAAWARRYLDDETELRQEV